MNRLKGMSAVALAVAMVLLAAGVALAMAPVSGSWKGHTGQNKAVSFTVNPSRRGICTTATCIAEFEITVAARCRADFGTWHGWANYRVWEVFGGLNVSAQGRFSFSDRTRGLSGSGTFTSESTVKGTALYKFKGGSPTPRAGCNKRVNWTARAVAPAAPR